LRDKKNDHFLTRTLYTEKIMQYDRQVQIANDYYS